MNRSHAIVMPWLAGLMGLLFAAAASAAPAAGVAAPDAPDCPPQALERAADAFVRGAPLPGWAELAPAPPVPPQASRRAVAVRLFETQLHVAASPVRLTNRVVQVNHASALAEIGQVAIDFNPQFERLLLHKLLIVRNGKTIDHTLSAPVRFLQREARLEENVYSGIVTASIVLPRVRSADTQHLVYSIAGENPTLLARFSHRVDWERPYPMQARRVTLVAPVQRRIAWRWFGGAGNDPPHPTETVTGDLRRLRFEARDLEGVGTEPMLPPHVQPMRRLQFSEYADWNEVARWAVPLFPAEARLPDEMAPLMARLRSLPDPQEQASQALQWVQTEIRHWSHAVGECALRPQLPAQVVQRGYGDCKDKAVLLSSMLRALGIDARPTLAALAARNDPASMLPAPDIFDHVIVQARLAGRDYYLDPTRHGQSGLLSRMGQRLEGAAVLPIDTRTQALAIVQSPNRAEIFRNQMHERLSLASFDAEGRLDVEIHWFGVHAEDLRQSLQSMDAAAMRHFVSASYLQQYGAIRLLGEPQLTDDRRLNELTIKASFAVARLARATGNAWAVPFAPGLGDAIVLPRRTSRRLPLYVPSFPVAYHYEIEMNWPDGATIATAPTQQRMDTPHFRLLTTRSVHGNIESRTVDFESKVSQVPPLEIASLFEDLNAMAQMIGGVMLAIDGSETRR